MKTKHGILISLGITLLIMTLGTAVAVEAPAEEWNKTFGEPGTEIIFYSAQQTVNTAGDVDGFMLAGQQYVYEGVDDEFYRALLIKTYENGTEEWNRTFGNENESSSAFSGQQTEDGGYILAGDKNYEVWLIKTDANGNEEWNMTFGSGGYDGEVSVQQTEDGGYILTFNKDSDAWLIKTNESGVEQWNKNLGGTATDNAYSVQQTFDKTGTPDGYILAGQTFPASDVSGEAWLIKTNETGDEQWNKTFGDVGVFDRAESVQQTFNTTGDPDGYILAGYKYNYPDADYDAWIIKTHGNGTEEWNRTFEGIGVDKFYSVQQTSDGGFILAGETENDAWLIKTNELGFEQWNKTLDSGGIDCVYSVQQTSDEGYVLTGSATPYGWLIKVAGTGQGATTYYVGGDGYPTIQEAVYAAADGDIILVYPGTYNENVDVYKSVNITSMSGAAVTNVVAFTSADHVFNVTADDVTISGFNVSGALDENVAGIYLDSCNNTMLTNTIVEGNYAGIVLIYTGNCVLTDNTVNDNEIGIILGFANNTILTENIVNDNIIIGIGLAYSYNNRLMGNTAANNHNGIYLDGSSNNELADNMVINNSAAGIFLNESYDTRLTSNTVSGNMEPTSMVTYGIYLSGNNSTLINNTISANADYGLYLASSSNNLIYNNYFHNSTNYTMLENYDGSSMWKSTEMMTYVYGGNTYTNYTGNYYFDYANNSSNDIDGDGIGDTAYYEDNYPLMFWPVISSTVGTDIIINDTTSYTIEYGVNLTIGVGDTLTIENEGILTIEEGGTLTIEDGGYIDNGGRINNYGTIDNSGQIDNNNNDGKIYHDFGGTIDNYGEIYNNEGGTIENEGWIDNYGTIENDGIIDNYGQIYIDYEYPSTIDNDGQIYNYWRIDNCGTIDNGGIIENENWLYCDGTIENYGTIDNDGQIYNDLFGHIINNEGAIIDNSGDINNHGSIVNSGIIYNYGNSINNYGTFANYASGTINNYGDINNNEGAIIDNAGIINIFSGTLNTDEGSITGEGIINDYTATIDIGDLVWEDLNCNGTRDAGEPGIPGVTVNLYNSSSILINTTTTDANGTYKFTGVEPGDYLVEFKAPPGYTFTYQDKGNDSLDSDANQITGQTELFELGMTDNSLDAGMWKPYDESAVGKGSFDSPEYAYVQDPSLAGKATFEFDAKYKKGILTGETKFHFREAGLEFQSQNYHWMMVEGQKATFRGNGTVYDEECEFLVSVISGSDDMFRIKIWNESGVIYDNNVDGDVDYADPITEIEKGKIDIKA